MRRKLFPSLTVTLLLLSAAACHSNSPPTKPETVPPASVDASCLINANQQPGNWMSYGRAYSEQRFSPVKQINEQNVGQLALAWYVDLDTRRGQEATPVSFDKELSRDGAAAMRAYLIFRANQGLSGTTSSQK